MIHAVRFQNDLIGWYKKRGRNLPWRNDPSPYKVWISEMMLQQTRVDTVIPYFKRFIAEIPTVGDLAEIEEEKLLKLWQGLGYYNRALNLKKAARIIVQKYDGRIPSELRDLQSLPGIGAYSAGAIASIAFGKAVPAVDGNVLRIIARITASRENIGDPEVKKKIESFVTNLLPAEHAGDFNQALMDLGAGLCLPNGEPKCGECPVNGFCGAYRQGVCTQIPVKRMKKKRNIEKKTVLVISSEKRFALRKRSGDGLLPNLWEFPNFEGTLTLEQCGQVLRDMNLSVQKIVPLKPSIHIFTHLEWHMTGFFVLAARLQDSPDLIWASVEEIRRRYSIPTAFKEYVRYVGEKRLLNY